MLLLHLPEGWGYGCDTVSALYSGFKGYLISACVYVPAEARRKGQIHIGIAEVIDGHELPDVGARK